MNPQNKWLKWAGFVIHFLIAGLMIFAGGSKLFVKMPPEVMEEMTKSGVADFVLLIGCGELIAAVLLLIPQTSPLGTLVTSGFWGGVICFHLVRHENFAAGSAFLALTWLGGWLRGSVPLLLIRPGTFGGGATT